MNYNVYVTVMISPEEELGYNTLSFSKKFTLRGENFSDIAQQVDFIYDTIEGKSNEHSPSV